MEKINSPAIPGSPGPHRAPENEAHPNIPIAEIGSPSTEQKLPNAAFSNPPVSKKESATVVAEYCEDHPYIQFKRRHHVYSFHCRIKNYNDPLEE